MSRAQSMKNSALREAWCVQRDASDLGFDWPDATGVFAKVHEEIDEIHAARADADAEHAKKELGDLLFSVVNLARFLNADPEKELRGATTRFENRFTKVKARLDADGRPIHSCSLEELDAVWEEVKAHEQRPETRP